MASIFQNFYGCEIIYDADPIRLADKAIVASQNKGYTVQNILTNTIPV